MDRMSRSHAATLWRAGRPRICPARSGFGQARRDERLMGHAEPSRIARLASSPRGAGHPWLTCAALMLAVRLVVWPALADTLAFAAQPGSRLRRALASGDLPTAERAVREQVRAHPQCPRAHLAYAALLARQGHKTRARHELLEAERLEPGLPFAPPNAVDDLARKLGIADRLPKRTQWHF